MLAWGSLKCVLSNIGFGINAMECLYEGVIVPTALNREAWTGGQRGMDRRTERHGQEYEKFCEKESEYS